MGETEASGATAAVRGVPLRPDTAPLVPLDSPLVVLPGVGPASAQKLAAAGLATLRDLLAYFPHRHRAVVEAEAPSGDLVGRVVRLSARVDRVERRFLGQGRSLVRVVFRAKDGAPVEVAFFNQPWFAKVLTPGQERRLEGRLELDGEQFTLRDLELLPARDEGNGTCRVRYRPIDGVSEARLRGLIARAIALADLAGFTPRLPTGLQGVLVDDPRVLLLAMHAPADVAEHERARVHFALIEAVGLFRRLEVSRRARICAMARAIAVDRDHATHLAQMLGFEPTDQQRSAMSAVRAALAAGAPMGVLLQGDVGSGKTAVAVDALLAVVRSGSQAALLAPTELLAEQHREWIAPRLARLGARVGCMTASMPPAERRALDAAVAAGDVDLLIGTHALLSVTTRFRDLALVVVDEHHRFGVEERRRLVEKGRAPHLLVMTATPIPRTLTLALFGDLDTIELRGRPRGRAPVPAVYVPRARWPRVLRAIDRHCRRGGRVYVVCPRIGEDGGKGGVQRVFGELSRRVRCGLVHGRMHADEQRAALAAFRDGSVSVLVGTTVLEVGVDVPDATLMVVIAADRFGLATLHQLRGRVGRGTRRGLCILTGEPTARTAAVVASRDGFALAEEDLRLRGAGELCGQEQSGAHDFTALEPLEDFALLRAARDAVRQEEVAPPCA